MTLRNSSPFVFLLVVILSIGCSKNSENDLRTKKDALTTRTWRFSSATFPDVPYYMSNNVLPSCYTDNIITFSRDGSGIIDESSYVCPTSNAGSFTWQLSKNAEKLTTSVKLIPGGSNEFRLKSVNDTTLVIAQNDVAIPGIVLPPVDIEVTFVHP